MNKLFVGLMFFAVAIGLVILFTVEHETGGIGPDALGGIEELGRPSQDFVLDDRDIKITTGRDEPARARSPGLSEEELLDPTRHDGILSPLERRQMDAKGYLRYRIREDDTLRKIASIYLGDGDLYTEILEHNPRVMHAKDIVEGQEIKIPLWLKR